MITLQAGDRIELIYMGNDPHPIETGAQGTVTFVSDLGDWTQVGVKWDNGRRLMLCLPQDQIKKVA